MTGQGVAALRSERDALQWWAEQFYDVDEFWGLPSRIAGWSRLDIVVHLADLFERVVDPAARPTKYDTLERSEAVVGRGRGRRPMDVVGDYLAVAAPAIEQLTAWQEPVVGDRLVHFGALGQHQQHLWADGLVFEHLCHRSLDLDGGAVLYDSLAPAVGWMLSSIPQTSRGLFSALTAPVVLTIDVPVSAEVTLQRVGQAVAVGRGRSEDAASIVATRPDAFVSWATGRRTWRSSAVLIEGDEDLAADVCDALQV